MTSQFWIPGAEHKLVPINFSRDPHIIPVGAVFHIAVSEAASLFGNFTGRKDGIEATGYIRRDGHIEQYRPLNVECDAQGDGNSFVRGGKRFGFTSWETQGGEFGDWTKAQIASMQKIMLHHNVHLDPSTPMRQCPDWDEPGFGYHSLFREWNHNGHTCPGRDRKVQWKREILPWLAALREGTKMNNVEAFKKGVLALAEKYPVPEEREAAHAQQATMVRLAKKEPLK